MRIVKVRIRAGDIANGEPQLVYPSRYNPVEVDRLGGGVGRLNKTAVSMSGDIGRGANEEWMCITLPNSLAEEYATDPDMMIVDSAQADMDMEQWRINNNIPEQQIDADIVNAITAKQTAKIPLTQSDLDALNPDNPEKGITKTRKAVKDVVPDVDDDLSILSDTVKQIQRT